MRWKQRSFDPSQHSATTFHVVGLTVPHGGKDSAVEADPSKDR